MDNSKNSENIRKNEYSEYNPRSSQKGGESQEIYGSSSTSDRLKVGFKKCLVKDIQVLNDDPDSMNCREEGEISDSSEDETETITHVDTKHEDEKWKKLRVLMVGDERVNDFCWKIFDFFPSQDFVCVPNAKLETICQLVDKHIYDSFDIVLIFAFQYDFTYFKCDDNYKVMLLNLSRDISFENLISTVKEYNDKWIMVNPNMKIIWTIPSAIDFLSFNSYLLEHIETLGNKLQNEIQNGMTRDFFSYSQILCKHWMNYLSHIAMLPLNDVLFMQKEHYKSSFISKNVPSFPNGYIINGIKPSEIMVAFLAYKLLEYLRNKGFYKNFKRPSLTLTLERLIEINSTLKNYIHRGKRKSHRHQQPSHKRTRRPSSSSRSSSSSKFSLSSPNHSRPRSDHPKGILGSSKDGALETNSHSDATVQKLLSLMNKLDDFSVSKETAYLQKHISCLREVHDIQYNRYRKSPTSHPLYAIEKEKFNLELSVIPWDDFWKQRLDEISEEQWLQKKQQLLLDLQKKVFINKPSFSSNGGSDKQTDKVESGDLNNYASIIENKLLLVGTTNEPDTLQMMGNSGQKIVDPVSSTENNPDSESDTDIDKLLNNPDFSVGLKEIDDVFQNAGISLTESASEKTEVELMTIMKEKESIESLNDRNELEDKKVCLSTSKLNSPQLNFISSNAVKVSEPLIRQPFPEVSTVNDPGCMYSISSDYLLALKMLFRLSSYLGPLGFSISNLYYTAVNDMKENKNSLKSLDEDAKVVLSLVNNKLNSLLKENLSHVQRAIYGEAAETLKRLLIRLNTKGHRFSGVNILSIASATVGQDVSKIVEFIKNTLLYHGYSDFTSEELTDMYLSVKEVHSDTGRR